MLKENEVKFYNQNGYLILKDKLDMKTLSDLINSTPQLIEEFKKNREQWVRFRVYQSKNFIMVEKPITKYRIIKNSFGISQKRPVVKMEIMLGEHSWDTNVSLAQRSGMIYPMLIGRKSLRTKYVIHPKKSFLLI